jgi:hypothetical protein
MLSNIQASVLYNNGKYMGLRSAKTPIEMFQRQPLVRLVMMHFFTTSISAIKIPI